MKRIGLYLLFIAAVVTGTLVTATTFWHWGTDVTQRHQQIDQAWAAAQDSYLRTDTLLNEIVSQIGYGGFIHNFKNYVLRGDENYAIRMQDNLVASKHAIYELMAKGNLQNDEHLATILSTLEMYEARIVRVREMRASEQSIQSIDTAVRVDDTQGISALKWLLNDNKQKLLQQRISIDQSIVELQKDIHKGLYLLLPVVGLNIAFILALLLMWRQSKRLQDSQQETALLQDTTPEAVLSITRSGHIASANKAAKELFGYADELIGMSVEQLMPPEYRQNHTRLRDMFTANPQRRQMGSERKVEILKKSGERREVTINLGSYNRGKNDLVIVACMHDVQEQNEQRRALQHYQHSIRLASEVASLGVWELDISQEIVSLDDWSLRLLKLPQDQKHINLEAFLACFNGSDQALLKTHLALCQQELQALDQTVQHRLTQGGDCFIRVVGQHTQDGLRQKIVGVLYDITPYENAKLQLERSMQQVEQANNAKSEFLANMSHEIRTPMNAILGTLNLLSDMQLSDRQSKLIISARASAESLLQILNDILDLSKLEAGKMVLLNE